MRKEIKTGLIVVGALALISAILGFIIGFLESFRIVFGSVYVLFLPGFIISFIFFPKTKKLDSKDKNKGEIDWLERIALSFALSIAIVPLAVFYLNLAGIRINLLNTSLIILGVILVSTAILWKKGLFKKAKGL